MPAAHGGDAIGNAVDKVRQPLRIGEQHAGDDDRRRELQDFDRDPPRQATDEAAGRRELRDMRREQRADVLRRGQPEIVEPLADHRPATDRFRRRRYHVTAFAEHLGIGFERFDRRRREQRHRSEHQRQQEEREQRRGEAVAQMDPPTQEGEHRENRHGQDHRPQQQRHDRFQQQQADHDDGGNQGHANREVDHEP